MELPGLCLGRKQLLPRNWLCKINLFSSRVCTASQEAFGNVEGGWLELISHGMCSLKTRRANVLQCPGQPCTRIGLFKMSVVPLWINTVGLSPSPFLGVSKFYISILYTQAAHLKKRNSLSFLKTVFLFAYFTHFLSFLFSCFSECKAGLPPIFETQLSLEIPELVFYPSLESGVKGGFYDIVEGLVASIFRISSLIPRLSPQNSSPHYQVLDL